jgi:acetyl esterase/lipase
MKNSVLAILSFVFLGLIASCKKDGSGQERWLNSNVKQQLYNIPYGPDERHKLDIWLPKNRSEATLVVVFVHGGAWIIGDKSVFSSVIKKYAENGIAAASINYRYANDKKGIHHPELPKDLKLAVDFIASKSDKWKISNSRFGIVGHSAGGHLILLTAYAFNDGKIKACASWAGPLDFLDQEQLAISGANDVFKNYVGTGLVNANDTLRYKDASPFWQVKASSVPTLLIYATKDDGIPYSNPVKMKAKLDSLSVLNQLITFEGQGHIWTGKTLERAENETLDWFKVRL